ncbi:MAG: type III pantothenate kinase [Litorivivens sp.]|jgi:type III pantothenate kinase
MENNWTTVLDAGNTALKIGQFQDNKLISVKVLSNDEVDATLVQSHIKGIPIYSASGKWDNELLELTAQLKGKIASIDLQLPLELYYTTPETLGLDRISNVCGARSVVKHGAILVVDIGTCITYDILTSENHYLGGSISPGVGIRFKGMNNLTARLPLIDLAQKPQLIGDSTKLSLQSGVFWGVLSEIEGMIARYSEEVGQLSVLLTGGDYQYFENALKSLTFASPNLTLLGLNEILLHNIK